MTERDFEIPEFMEKREIYPYVIISKYKTEKELINTPKAKFRYEPEAVNYCNYINHIKDDYRECFHVIFNGKEIDLDKE